MLINVCRQWQTAQAVKSVERGEIIAYPTEAVWGLGCDPFNADAVAKLLKIKRRPMSKGLILVASDVAQLGALASSLSGSQYAQIATPILDQPTTWLLPHQNKLPFWITGEHKTVAIRLSTHPTVKALCNNFGGMLISTSANPTSLQPATTLLRARNYFGSNIARYVAGKTGNLSAPTQIIELSTGRRLR